MANEIEELRTTLEQLCVELKEFRDKLLENPAPVVPDSKMAQFLGVAVKLVCTCKDRRKRNEKLPFEHEKTCRYRVEVEKELGSDFASTWAGTL